MWFFGRNLQSVLYEAVDEYEELEDADQFSSAPLPHPFLHQLEVWDDDRGIRIEDPSGAKYGIVGEKVFRMNGRHWGLLGDLDDVVPWKQLASTAWASGGMHEQRWTWRDIVDVFYGNWSAENKSVDASNADLAMAELGDKTEEHERPMNRFLRK